jgi:hypothetical protein
LARRVSVIILPAPMSSRSRIQQIIDHERSISRSLTPFGVTLAVVTLSFLFLALRS